MILALSTDNNLQALPTRLIRWFPRCGPDERNEVAAKILQLHS